MITQPNLYIIPDGTEALPGIRFGADTDNGVYRAAANDWHLVVGADTGIRLTTTAIVFNEDNPATPGRDVRIEGVDLANGVFYDASSGTFFLNDSANANMNVGATFQQGASDNQILAFKSSDVTHALTTAVNSIFDVETDDYGVFGKVSALGGGLAIIGLADAGANATDQAVRIESYALDLNVNTAKTTAGRGQVEMFISSHNGSGALANVSLDVNVFAIRVQAAGAETTRFLFDAEGSGHADVEWVAFDTHDDLALLDQLQASMAGTMPRLTPGRYGRNPILYFRDDFERMGIVGKDSWHTEGRGDGRIQERQMVNFTRLSMLHHGAILQVADRMMDTEQRLLGLERKLSLLEARN